MNRLVFDYNNTFLGKYNCSFYEVNIVLPIEQRKSILHGTALLMMGIVFMTLYLPCLYAMSSERLRANSCYRLMLIMAILDVLELSFTAVYSGIATIMGWHYCDTDSDTIRMVLYFQGCLVLGLWFAYTYTSLILALNRCLSFGSYKRVFDHPIWLLGTVAVLFTTVWFVNPLFYHSFNGVWLFTPHPLELAIVDRDDLLTQSMLVTGSVALCAGSYACLELFNLSAEFTKAAHILWILVEGAPSVVYLTLNQTILCILCAKGKRLALQTSSTQYAITTHSRKPSVTPAMDVVTASPM
uniref:G protein-coupled receptor n=1 Tax=Bursaphelenchus xylophilus TaxID=6326 RepID=A0A1I7RWV3_BURXY